MANGFYDEDNDSGFEECTGRGRKKKKPALVLCPVDDDDEADLDRRLAGEPCNDLGNARRFVGRFGNDFMFVEKVGWFFWDGARWNHDLGKQTAFKRGQEVSELIWRERGAFEKSPPRKWDRDSIEVKLRKLAAWTEVTGQAHVVKSMLVSAEPHLNKPIDSLDADPLLCPCENGTLVLGRETAFRASLQTDYCTRRLGVPFVKGAACPRFKRFLNEIIRDPEIEDFLQRIFGYCLSGSTREQVLFMFHGTGNNGKSTLMNVIRHVMGDFALVSPVATFLAKREGNSGGDATPDLARLPGARLVSASEPPEGARLDEGRVKEVTGGEPITARHLNQPFFSFRPVFKVAMLVNNLPTIRGVDHGIWRRIRLVPFTVQIPDDQIDRDLDQRLIEEGSGVLQWMVEGFEAYTRVGLDPPDSAIAAVAAYRADQDLVGEFLRECCTMTGDARDPSSGAVYEENARDLFRTYREWCSDSGLETLSARKFYSKLVAGSDAESRMATRSILAFRSTRRGLRG